MGLSRHELVQLAGCHLASPLHLWLQLSGWGAPTLTGPDRDLSLSGALTVASKHQPFCGRQDLRSRMRV